ncbi:hypothetical protein DFJ67_5757 [Asanoa ferruginea]|uniref:Uncharacterized protein n=2 Tax=Asanoa ferruginea TaxID=53367 RepID=A0A3D9ZQS6_9ACTN|nr:hypothetical protein DFJ67_5757 [Asanoa ferruginea]
MRAAFPNRLRGAEVAAVEMVILDADVVGCVSAWLRNGGNIDGPHCGHLASCEEQLIRVIPELNGGEAAYYQRLLDMTALVLESLQNPRSG